VLAGVWACRPFWARVVVQRGARACAGLMRTRTRVTRGWGVLQRTRHSGLRVVQWRNAGERRCDRGDGLQPTSSSAKGPGKRAGAHRGLVVAGVAAQGGRRRGPAVALGEARGRGRRKASPGFWTSRLDSWMCYDGAMGVRMTGAAPAASKFTGGATHRQRRQGGIPARAGSEVGDGGLSVDPGPEVELLRCLAGTGGGEAATPRRRRASTRLSGVVAALGLRWRLRDGEVQGRHGVVPIYRAADHPRRERPGEESQRDSRPEVALRGGDGPGVWAGHVSGRASGLQVNGYAGRAAAAADRWAHLVGENPRAWDEGAA
jgi:hypothetical protein